METCFKTHLIQTVESKELDFLEAFGFYVPYSLLTEMDPAYEAEIFSQIMSTAILNEYYPKINQRYQKIKENFYSS